MEESFDALFVEGAALDVPRLLREYGDGLLRMCTLCLGGDVYLAEDAVQDTFIKAMGAWPSFRGVCSEKTWLTGIAINICRSYLRSPWRRKRVEWEPKEIADDRQGVPCDDTLLRAVLALPVKYREVVVLYYYRQLKAKEVAEMLGVSVSAVTMRLTRARELLKKSLKGWYYDEE